MGLVVRHSGAPYTAEELDGTEDLEVDVRNLYSAINGGLDDANFDGSADIDVDDKVADASIPGSKFTDQELTTAKIVAAAVPRHYVDTASSESVDTSDTAWHDVAGITQSTHVLAADQFVLLDFTATIDPDSGVGLSTISAAFDLEGAIVSPEFTILIGGTAGSLHENAHNIRATYGYVVTDALAGAGKNHKPQLKIGSGLTGDTVTITSAVFSVQILPGLPEGTPGSGR